MKIELSVEAYVVAMAAMNECANRTRGTPVYTRLTGAASEMERAMTTAMSDPAQSGRYIAEAAMVQT